VAGQIDGLRAEMKSEFSAVRQEMKSEFIAVRQEMATKAELEAGLASIRREMATKVDMQAGFDKLSRQLDGHEEDIKHLYLMIDELRKDFRAFTRAERSRFEELEAFALRVAEQSGIPYKPGASKRRP